MNCEIRKGIVSFDMDMTLLNHADWQIPDSAKEALKRLQKNYYVVIATGRDMDAKYSTGLTELVKPDAVIHLNGTKITVGGKLIYEHRMKKELVEGLLRFTEGKDFAMGVSVVLGLGSLGSGGSLLVGPGGLLLGGRFFLGLGCLGGGGFGSLRLVVHIGEDALDALHLIVLGQVLEDDGKLLLIQSLHMVLGGRGVLGEDVDDLLGVAVEILGHFMDTILDIQQMSHLLLRLCQAEKGRDSSFFGRAQVRSKGSKQSKKGLKQDEKREIRLTFLCRRMALPRVFVRRLWNPSPAAGSGAGGGGSFPPCSPAAGRRGRKAPGPPPPAFSPLRRPCRRR